MTTTVPAERLVLTQAIWTTLEGMNFIEVVGYIRSTYEDAPDVFAWSS